MTNQQKWHFVRRWVDENLSLVRIVASPYRLFVAADQDDFRQEAYIAGFQALEALLRRGERMERLGAYFRRRYRTSCITVASIGQTSNFADGFTEKILADEKEEQPDDSQEAIEAALRRAEARRKQRRTMQVCRWILSQPSPVSIADIARRFEIGERATRNLLERATRLLAGTGVADPDPEPERAIFSPSPHPARVRAKKLRDGRRQAATDAVRRVSLVRRKSAGARERKA